MCKTHAEPLCKTLNSPRAHVQDPRQGPLHVQDPSQGPMCKTHVAAMLLLLPSRNKGLSQFFDQGT